MDQKKETSLKAEAYKDLRYRIITQKLPPGELLIEKDLMADYQIGRTPLREIFIELQRQGLIRKVPRSGTWVAPLDLDFVRQIAEVRMPLERLAGELAAERISEQELEALERILEQAEADQSREDADLQELIQLESRFHHTLYAATGNVKLEELLIEFLAVSSRLWHSVFFTKAHLGRMFKDQRNILKALKMRDGKRSAELLVNHTQSYFGPLEGLENR